MDEAQEPMEDEERKEPRRDSGELGVQQLLGSVLDRGRIGIGFCQAGLNLRDSAVRPAEEIMEVKGKAGSVAVDKASSDRTAEDAPKENPAEDDGRGNEEARIIKGQKKVVSPGRE